jgi:uncharacterized protein
MVRVVHFEIHADEPERAVSFYGKVFGWQIHKKSMGKDDYWLIYTGRQDEKGINGGLKRRMAPNASTVATMEVDNIDEYSKKITTLGGKLLTPKIILPNTGAVMYCEDTEGNVFSLIEKGFSSEG